MRFAEYLLYEAEIIKIYFCSPNQSVPHVIGKKIFFNKKKNKNNKNNNNNNNTPSPSSQLECSFDGRFGDRIAL